MGDTVYKISDMQQPVWNECGFCGGTGSIFGKNGEERLCHDCMGNKGKNIYESLGWHIEAKLTVGKVAIEYTGESKGIDTGPIKFSNFGPQSEKHKESYMCYETGIGSGSVHYVENLFGTKEYAQEECNKRNRES